MKKDFMNKTKELFVKASAYVKPAAEKSLIFAKNLSAKIYAFLKNVIEKSLPVIKSISRKFAEWVKAVYKNHLVPLAVRIKMQWDEFVRSSKPDIKRDFENLSKSIKDTFDTILYYGKTAFVKAVELSKKLYAYIRQKLSGKKSVPVLPGKKQSTISVFRSPVNLIRHIKYLSYQRLVIYLLAFIVLDVFLIWFSSYRVLYARHYWEGAEDKKVFIRPGKSIDDILAELKEKDIIKSKFIFKVYLKLSGKDDKIISKGYIFKSGINNSELLNLLTDKNMIQTERFTVIEGLRIKQIAKNIENKLQLSSEKFIKETENDSLINMLGLKGKITNLEGFLFPDTYYLPLDIDERGLVILLFNEFRKKVLSDEEVKSGIKDSRFNLLQVVTLASIIQGETNLKDEMPIVSGVYQNRLKKNMRLEADPTIQYVIPDGPKPRLKYSDLKFDSPYNTYLHFGLPPGPINNPGLHAIKSVLKPDKNNYIFFVATGNGGHKFSETYQQHLKAVEEYKKNLEKKSGQ